MILDAYRDKTPLARSMQRTGWPGVASAPYDRHRRLGHAETEAYAAGVDAVMCSAAQIHGLPRR